MDKTMLWVDGRAVKTPSTFAWGLQDVSGSQAGRVELNDLMYKNRTSQKRKLSLGWNNPNVAETAAILQAFNPEYISIRYPDALSGTYQTREFYVGDRSTSLRSWMPGRERYTSVTFDVIER